MPLATILRRLSAWLALGAAAAGARAGPPRDFWPFWVGGTGPADAWTAAGPLVFRQPSPEGGCVEGFRPVFLRWRAPNGRTEEATVLYPIFVYRTYGDTYEWSLFQLVNRYGRGPASPRPPVEGETLDLWPFYFSKSGPTPADSFHALIPLGGTLKNRFTYARISFVLFPLYVQMAKEGYVTTSTPWPFIRVTRGAEHGFALWPLYETDTRPGAWSRRFSPWPLVWSAITEPPPGSPPGTAPTRSTGFLPFYASVRGPGLTSVDWLWPFFGYTDRGGPDPYHEVRYCWPFFVQGRGPNEYRNRWGPFYTHSNVAGLDKIWSPWPLVKRERWREGQLAMSKVQLLYFLYWRGEERSVSNPAAAPAYTAHYWPFLSVWSNGAGRREWQAPSPFSVFFPNNREVKAGWTPLLAICRHSVQPDGSSRTSLLWNAVAWERRPRVGLVDFHVGPLLSEHRRSDGRPVWRVFAMEFSGRSNKVERTARRP